MEHYQKGNHLYSIEYRGSKRGMQFFDVYHKEEQLGTSVTYDEALDLCDIHYVEVSPPPKRRHNTNKKICKKAPHCVEMNEYMDFIHDMDVISMVEDYETITYQNNFYEE